MNKPVSAAPTGKTNSLRRSRIISFLVASIRQPIQHRDCIHRRWRIPQKAVNGEIETLSGEGTESRCGGIKQDAGSHSFCSANLICKEPEEDAAYCPVYGEDSDDYAAVSADVCSIFCVEQIGQRRIHDHEEHHRVHGIECLP